MNYYNRILFLAPLLIFNYSFSQDYNAQQKKLEAQKLSIKKEIEKINVLVSENKKMTITLLDNIEDVELKISVRNKLIEVNNQQSKNLSNQIKNKNDRIYDLQIELKKLKDEYATIVSNSSKRSNRSSNSPSVSGSPSRRGVLSSLFNRSCIEPIGSDGPNSTS